MSQTDLLEKTIELKKTVMGFETNSFVCHYYYLLNCQLRTSASPLTLNSPLRQLMYLLSVFMDTNPDTGRKFSPMRWDREPIENLLNNIEQGYGENYLNGLDKTEVSFVDSAKFYRVTSQAFANYFSNGRLSYIEQDIEKIKEIFKEHEAFLTDRTGLKIADFLDFFELIEILDAKHFTRFRALISNDNFLKECEIHYDDVSYFTDTKLDLVADVVEKHMQTIPLKKQELYDHMSIEVIDKLLEFFSCKRQEKDTIRYFNSECLLLKKPIIMLSDNAFILPCAKQLIVAISDFLFELAKQDVTLSRRILRSRDMFLESKTCDLFCKFFGAGNLRVFENYYVDDKEQDLLLLYKDTAFIIECKASKLNAPYRDPVAAFDRIANEFKGSIQKGYDQTLRIKRAFMDQKELLLCNSNRQVIERINTARYKNIFSIIVTAERFGPIQTDLGLLLKLPEWDDYPWSVYIDDLEILLLTLQRKKNYQGELLSFLTARTKLHERLICSDEAELFGYFLMDKRKFLQDCGRFEEVYISSSDMHLLFDELYQTGLGFEFERKMSDKAIRNDNPRRKELRKRLGLKPIKFDNSSITNISKI